MLLKRRTLAAVLGVSLLFCGCTDDTRVYDDTEIYIGTTSAATSSHMTTAAPETEETPQLAEAQEILATMSLPQKVGQMFIARYPDSNAAEDAAKYQLGGYILFARDFKGETPDSVREMIQQCQSVAEIPMLMGVDEEGGEIVRVSKHKQFRSEPFRSPMELLEGGIEAVAADTREKAELLASLGLNMNFAPVCDLPRSGEDYIYDRSYGTDVRVTSDCISAVVSEMNGSGMLSVLKHFPGYGNNVDTHKGVAYDERPLAELRELDFLPFAAGISAGASCVMVSHNIIVEVDGELPASLSPAVHELLREELGFGGVIVTDELSMGAIEDFTGSENAAVHAVLAGNDLLCVTDYAASIEAVLAAVESGEISEQRIDESVLRLLEMKLAYGLLQQ